MIFVTVGTHEQPFNRLIEEIDRLKQEGVITDEVQMQTGYCTYEPKYCKWETFFPYKKMQELAGPQCPPHCSAPRPGRPARPAAAGPPGR